MYIGQEPDQARYKAEGIFQIPISDLIGLDLFSAFHEFPDITKKQNVDFEFLGGD